MATPRNIGKQIVELRLQGKTYLEIKEVLKCSTGTISYWLGEGQKEKQKESGKKVRIRKYEKYFALKDGPCCDCNKRFPPLLMHWDHLGKELKEGGLSQMIKSHSWQDVINEIAKCELVCSNCHGLRTIKRLIETGAASQLMIDYYNRYIEEQDQT